MRTARELGGEPMYQLPDPTNTLLGRWHLRFCTLQTGLSLLTCASTRHDVRVEFVRTELVVVEFVHGAHVELSSCV